jgi:V/A-type H+-transporting ATPase subunit E
MGATELIEALRSEGEKKALEIRRETEAEIARLRVDASARLDRLRQEYGREQLAASALAERAILAEAERKERLTRLAAENKLAERLHAMARSSLPQLRNREYDRTFSLLAAELPASAWETVRVNPADTERATGLFAAATIMADGSISGGMESTAAGGRLRIVNTLEKRLERGWPELLPELFREIGKEG